MGECPPSSAYSDRYCVYHLMAVKCTLNHTPFRWYVIILQQCATTADFPIWYRLLFLKFFFYLFLTCFFLSDLCESCHNLYNWLLNARFFFVGRISIFETGFIEIFYAKLCLHFIFLSIKSLFIPLISSPWIIWLYYFILIVVQCYINESIC